MLIPTHIKNEINKWFKSRNYSSYSNAKRAAQSVSAKALKDLPVACCFSVNKLDKGSYQVEFYFN
jgi:hypothetical protein